MKLINTITLNNKSITVIGGDNKYYINIVGETLDKVFTVDEIIYHVMSLLDESK